MPRKNWKLTNPRRGFTHVQITSLKIEYDRTNCDPPTPGHIDVWWTFGEKVLGIYVDEDSRAHDWRIKDAGYIALDAAAFPALRSLQDIEHAIYSVLASRAIIPPGALEDR